MNLVNPVNPVDGAEVYAKAQSAFDEGKQGQALIYIPAIVLAELYFLNEKKQHAIDYSATFALLIQSAHARAESFKGQNSESRLEWSSGVRLPQRYLFHRPVARTSGGSSLGFRLMAFGVMGLP